LKIICIGRNYADHARELGNEVPEEPVIFLKPGSALSINSKPFFIPDFSDDVHYELEFVLRISRNGKCIEEKFASRYYETIGLGIDFTARDLQNELKARGLPWEKAKAFDGSAALGDFIPVDAARTTPYELRLDKNGETVQQSNSSLMLFGFDRIIAEVSRYFTLMVGDLIYTGTPAGVGRVDRGDHLQGYLDGHPTLDVRVK